MSCELGIKPLVSGQFFDQIEREFLGNTGLSGNPLLLEKLEEKEAALCFRAKDMASRTVQLYMDGESSTPSMESVQELEQNIYSLLVFGYLLHSKATDVSWENDFGDLFKGLGS